MCRCPVPRSGNGVEAPGPLAGFRVVGVDEAANAVLASRHADDHFVLDDERGDGRGVALLVVLHRRRPRRPAGLHVERDEMRVERRHEQAIAEHAESLVDETAARRQRAGRRQLAAVAPNLAARARVDRPRQVQRAGHVQHVVAQQRRRFEAAARNVGLEHPLRNEAASRSRA